MSYGNKRKNKEKEKDVKRPERGLQHHDNGCQIHGADDSDTTALGGISEKGDLAPTAVCYSCTWLLVNQERPVSIHQAHSMFVWVFLKILHSFFRPQTHARRYADRYHGRDTDRDRYSIIIGRHTHTHTHTHTHAHTALLHANISL